MLVSPLTGLDDVSLLQTLKVSQLVEDWKQQFQIDIRSEFEQLSEIKLYQCSQTKLKFFDPPIAGSGNLYQQLQRFDWYYMPHKWEHEIAISDLTDCHNVLEVGSAFGDFVETGLRSGLNIRGIELNQAAVSLSQEKNLPISRMDLQEFADLHPFSLDAICSFQVLEHISDPKEFIKSALQALKPNGNLILCVPNAESHLHYIYSLLDTPPHHVTRWSETTFRALENLFPIQLEKVVKEPLASYHIPDYVSAYGGYLRDKIPLRLGILLFNQRTRRLYERILELGFNKYLVGQSLYVKFKKI